MALPKVSAVMPVPSDTKNTVRWAWMGRRVGFAMAGQWGADLQSRNLHFVTWHPHQQQTGGGVSARCQARVPVHPYCGETVFNFRSFSMSTLFSPTDLVVPFENCA
jgi:hypothetical protein